MNLRSILSFPAILGILITSCYLLSMSGIQAQPAPEIIYYKFDQPGGTVENEADPGAGADANGTLQGGVQICCTGQFGMALEGSGSGGDGVLTGWSGNLDFDWTISFWWDNTQQTSHYILGDDDNFDNFRLWITSSGDVTLRGTGVSSQPTNYTVLNGGTIVMTFVHDASAQEVSFYVDGQLEQTYSTGGFDVDVGNMLVGSRHTSSSLQPGSFMDEFRFYDRALSAQEVSETWNVELGAEPFDAAADGIEYPETFHPGTQDLGVRVMNAGTDVKIGSANIGYQFENDAPVEVADYQFPDSLEFEETYTMDFTGTDALDIPASGTYSLKIWMTNPNGTHPDDDPDNDTLHLEICTAVEGNWIVDPGGGGDFQTFTEAMDYFGHCGLSDDATLHIDDGIYQEAYEINGIPGASDSSILTIRGESRSGTRLRFDPDEEEHPVLSIINTSYLELENITIESQSNLSDEGPLEIRTSNNIVLDNVRLLRPASTDGDNFTLLADSVHNFSVHNSRFDGGGVGMAFLNADPVGNIELINNTVEGAGLIGIGMVEQNSPKIEGNEIIISSDGSAGSDGIFLVNSISSDISRNSVINAGRAGIYLNAENAAANDTSYIVNNFLGGNFRSASADGGGLYVENSNNLRIYHNSVHQDFENGNVVRFNGASNMSDIDIRNNIFAYTGGGAGQVLYEDSAHFSAIDYNLYYSTGNSLFHFDGSDYDSLQNYQSAEGMDLNAFQDYPAFISNTDLRIADLDQVKTGDPSLGIGVDHFDNVRDASAPAIGAHEPLEVDLSIRRILEPTEEAECGKFEEDFYVIIRNMGIGAIGNFQIHADLSGAVTDQFTYHFEDSLPGYSEPDTIYLGTFNSVEGGMVDFTVYHDLQGDMNPNNDTVSTTIEFLAAPNIVALDQEFCGAPGSVQLEATADSSHIFWYSKKERGLLLHQGETFQTPELEQSSSFFVEGEHMVTGCRNAVRRTVSAISLPSPHVSLTPSEDFMGTIDEGTLDNPDKSCFGDSVKYTFHAPAGMSNADYGDTWEVDNVTAITQIGVSAFTSGHIEPQNGDNGYVYVIPHFSEEGATFTISMDIHNLETGCEATTERHLNVNAPPFADIVVDDAVCTGFEFEVENHTTIGGNQEVQYTYDFGDGTQITTNDTLPVYHTYETGGTYTIELHAQSEVGCYDVVTETVEVTTAAIAEFEVPEQVCEGAGTEFVNNSDEAGMNVEYNWDFGDGNTSTDENPVHTFAESGNYIVTLAAETDEGCVNEATHELEVLGIPEVGFTAGDACAGESIRFSNATNRPTINTFHWDFGDGNTSTAVNPQHAFSEGGTYEVTLTETNRNGCSDSVTVDVDVFELPESGFTHESGDDGHIDFVPDNDELESYTWTVQEQTYHEPSPSHLFTQNGYHLVTLTVVDENGCQSSTSSEVEYWSVSLADEANNDFSVNAYPNPSAESVTVALTLEHEADVNISLLDMSGRMIQSVNDGILQEGQNELTFNENGELAGGIYLLKFNVDGAVHTERIEIIK